MALKEVTTRLMDAVFGWITFERHISVREFVELMSGVFDRYPILVPDRFGPIEPLRMKYTPETFRDLVHDSEAEYRVIWKGKKLAHSLHRMADNDATTGDNWAIDYDRRQISDTTICAAVDMLTNMPVAIASVHAVSESEMHYCQSVGAGWGHGEGCYCFHAFFRHQRAFGLPTLAWRTYFGATYIKHFGKDRLLAAPAWSVKEVHPNVISIQLSENMDSIATDWEQFHAVRQRVIAYLGAESFQRPRGPGDPPPMSDQDRGGVPGTSIPEELVAIRQESEANHREIKRRADQEEASLPAPIQSFEELLTSMWRFQVVRIKPKDGGPDLVVRDYGRREFIEFPDDATREAWIKKLLDAGAEYEDATWI